VSSATPAGWLPLIDALEPHLAPEWTRQARQHGDQPWVRLIALVDAHAQLSNPRLAEKIAATMSELAEGREEERAGWDALREQALAERQAVVAQLVDAAPGVLSSELMPLFVRSVDPAKMM
jgi:hypothetical protein